MTTEQLNECPTGGVGTIHANAAADVPARLEALASSAGLDRAALHSQLAAALDAVVHLARDGSGLRRVAEVRLLRRASNGLVDTEPAVRFTEGGELRPGSGWSRLAAMCGRGDRPIRPSGRPG